MAQQTAMQQIIEWAISLKDKEQQCIDWIVIKNKAEELLSMEKEHIIKAYSNGSNDRLHNFINNNYYNETYKK